MSSTCKDETAAPMAALQVMRDHIKLNQTPPAAEQSAQQQQQDAILAVVVARHLGAMKEHWQRSVMQLGAAHQALAGQARPLGV